MHSAHARSLTLAAVAFALVAAAVRTASAHPRWVAPCNDDPSLVGKKLYDVDDPGVSQVCSALGLVVGPSWLSVPHAIQSAHSGGTTYSGPDGWLRGVSISTAIEDRYVLFALDYAFHLGVRQASAQVASGSPPTSAAPESIFLHTAGFRLGPRIPLQYGAVAAGSGFKWAFASAKSGDDFQFGSHATFDGQVPLWASLTVRPFCSSWSLQAQAAYNVSPGDADWNSYEVGAGLLWQPGALCSESPRT
jgi:hypothetical protein